MKIKDLKVNDWVQFIGTNGQSQYGKFTKRCRNLGTNEDFTDLIMHNGLTYRLTDNDDFVVVELPFSQKLNETVDVSDRTPEHYKGSDGIDVIEFLYQQLSFEEFKGYMKGNMVKYPVRSSRKGSEKEDIKKAYDYAGRLLEKME
ncbi:DUF3310 domain-containing protein [Staphylococcus pasteuri]|uniref:DUF3310 domain-containing protein n=1 Tax=Staphylococcus pasteuri TaxID=45972 RepID=UPI0021D35FA0|nr:DUF3310 domain-containing protein [Staphylococcus pasteuri]UXR66984.1 DUF3310 domain-containing protein [Staphylococcus pasteuri]